MTIAVTVSDHGTVYTDGNDPLPLGISRWNHAFEVCVKVRERTPNRWWEDFFDVRQACIEANHDPLGWSPLMGYINLLAEDHDFLIGPEVKAEIEEEVLHEVHDLIIQRLDEETAKMRKALEVFS